MAGGDENPKRSWKVPKHPGRAWVHRGAIKSHLQIRGKWLSSRSRSVAQMGLISFSRLTLFFPVANMDVRVFNGHLLTLLLCLISMARVSGAVIKGYEKDVGTKTSFYGFTAYSLVSSLQILGHRGFSNIPRGKVSRVHAVHMHSFDGMLLVCDLQF